MENKPIIKIKLEKTNIIPKEFRKDLPPKPVWTEPEYVRRQNLKGCSYLEPGGWNRKGAVKPKGFYYYPYEDAIDGMLYFSYSDNPNKKLEIPFPYHAVVMGLVNDNEEKIRSETEVLVGGIRGMKVNFYRNLGETYLEMDVYILPKDDTLYRVMFGEKDYIRPEMKKCEQTIIDSFIFE